MSVMACSNALDSKLFGVSPTDTVMVMLQETQLQDDSSQLSASSITLLMDCSMPSPLLEMLYSKQPVKTWQSTLKTWLQAFPCATQPIATSVAISVPLRKSDLHAVKPVNNIQQKMQRGFMQTALDCGKRFGSACVSRSPLSHCRFPP